MVFRQRSKHGDNRDQDDQSPDITLQHNPILYHSNGIILRPDAAIEDFPKVRLGAVFLNPDLVIKRVASAKGIHTDTPFGAIRKTINVRGRQVLFVVVIAQRAVVAVLFPGAQGTAVGFVQDDAEAFKGSHKARDSGPKGKCGEEAPPAGFGGEN